MENKCSHLISDTSYRRRRSVFRSKTYCRIQILWHLRISLASESADPKRYHPIRSDSNASSPFQLSSVSVRFGLVPFSKISIFILVIYLYQKYI